MVRRSALRALVLLAGLGAGLASDEETLKAIAELQGMVDEQKHRIEALKAEDVPELQGRRLQSQTPSLYAVNYTLEERPYNDLENIEGAMDHLWLIICAALVMFMQAGFAMVEAGSCRSRNVQNILLKNLTDVCVGTLGWWTFGWSFAYSGPFNDDGFKKNRFAGYEQFLGHHFLKVRSDGQQEPSMDMVNWFFQWAFCSAAATIVSGGVAERVNFPGYVIYSFLMTAFIYPMVVSWVWGYGFLADMNDVGAFDFAGSGVVHMTGGVGALVGAAMAGARVGRFDGQTLVQRVTDTPEEFAPHHSPIVVLGTFSLWFGWYGFNCGSTLELHDIATGMKAAHVAMNTTLAAATGGLTVFLLRLGMTKGRFDVPGFCNGILAGLVSITAGCSNVECGSAVLIAIIGAFVFQGASTALRAACIDDPVDAFAVHGAAGAWGVLAAALFDWGKSFDFVHGANGFGCMTDSLGRCQGGLGKDMVAAAFSELGVIIAWVGGLSAIIFGILRVAGLLRASDDLQNFGFDRQKHSPNRGYRLEDYAEQPGGQIEI